MLLSLRRRRGLTTAVVATALAVAPLAAPVAGALPAAPAAAAVSPIDAHHARLGGDRGVLGPPTGPEYPVRGGSARNYRSGQILQSPSTPPRSVRGSIHERYGAAGYEQGRLGFPLTDEMPLRAAAGPGAFSHFQGGSIYWSVTTGARAVWAGAIRDRWAASGWEAGPLGYPTTEERPTPTRQGAFTHFQGGSVYWSPATGAQEVRGAIRDRWASLGWETGRLGFPRTGEYAVAGGRASAFEGGWIRWDRASGATTVVHDQPAPPAVPEPVTHRMLSTWIPYWDSAASYRAVVANADLFEFASPFWYRATDTTRIQPETGAGDQAVIDGLHRVGVRVVPTVTETMSAQRMADVLGDPAQRAAHVAALVRVATSRDYDGLDLNYEQMAVTADPAVGERVRAGFNALVGEACPALRAAAKTCMVTVMARTSDDRSLWRGRLATYVYDYAHLGAVADRLRIMAYAEHGPRETAGPISTPAWNDAILRYATGKVPASKIEMALPLYGYDWAAGGPVAARMFDAAEAQRRRLGRPYTFDAAAGEPTYAYRDAGGREHRVWYQDARATQAKVDVARRYGVASVGTWFVGREDPATWEVFRRAFTS